MFGQASANPGVAAESQLHAGASQIVQIGSPVSGCSQAPAIHTCQSTWFWSLVVLVCVGKSGFRVMLIGERW